MTSDVQAALWVNDLLALPPLDEHRDGYVLAEVGADSEVTYFTQAAGLTESAYTTRRAAGHRVFAAWQQPRGDLAGWCWTAADAAYAPPIDTTLRFKSDECYGFEAGVVPQHRGHHLFTRLLVCAGQRRVQQGYRWMWVGILDANMASRCSCVAAGFRPILHLRFQTATNQLYTWPVEYADERLVVRGRTVLAEARQIAVAYRGLP